MTLFEPSSSNSVIQPLPSLPPSPTEELDLGGASSWKELDDDQETLNGQRTGVGNGSLKGKERAREISLDDEEDDIEGEEEGNLTPTAIYGGYPPLKGDEEESRRIEENLKRLEGEERQRRKAARESATATTPSSVITDVSRRASLLFTSRRSVSGGSNGRRPPLHHHVHSRLGQSSEDALPLSDLHNSANLLVSPPGSKPPSPTPPPRNTGKLPIPTIIENPFEPPDSATPLRGFQQDEQDAGLGPSSAVMRPSSPPPPSLSDKQPLSPFGDDIVVADGPPTLQASSSFSRPHPAPPPPLPLDLPPPKTPPPRAGTPGGSPVIASPPGRVSAPSTSHRDNGDTSNQDRGEEDEVEHRWWTDWLCGCREDKDRDNAGRTNPFE